MKSFLVYVCIFALVGSVLCGRFRRQAPPSAVGGTDVDGATPPPPPSTADKLNGVVAGLILEQQNNLALGLPVDPKKVEKILTLTMVIGIVGGELSDPNREALDDLMTAAAEQDTATA